MQVQLKKRTCQFAASTLIPATISGLLLTSLVGCGGNSEVVWRGNDTLAQENWKQAWGLTAWNEQLGIVTNGFWGYDDLDLVADPYNPNHTVLRVRYPKDGVTTESGTGLLFQPEMELENNKQACLSYNVLFDNEFDFGLVGGKIPGLYGYDPESNIPLDATTCSGPYEYDSATCFSARLSFRNLTSQGYPETDIFYEVIPWMYEGECRDSWICDLPYGEGMTMRNATPENFAAIKGQWANIRQEIKLNDDGQANGHIKVWYDQTLVYDEQNLTIVLGNGVPVSGILFHALFGQGFDFSQGSPVEQYSYYSDFEIANSCAAF